LLADGFASAALARSLARIMAVSPFGFDRAVLTVDDKLRVESATFEFPAALLPFSFGLFLRVVAAEIAAVLLEMPATVSVLVDEMHHCARHRFLHSPNRTRSIFRRSKTENE